MAKFFNYYPKTFYVSNNNTNGVDTVTNIIARFSFENELKQNASAFYKYNIQDGDTPEIIAHKYYGNIERHWIVLLFNDIIDPQFDWPLDQRTIIEYIDTKYSSPQYADTANTSISGLSWAMNVSHVYAYYKVITTTANDGVQTIAKLQVDGNTYNNIASSTTSTTTQAGELVTISISKESQTYYNYEIESNEKKREIKLLKKEFVSAVEKEFKKVIK